MNNPFDVTKTRVINNINSMNAIRTPEVNVNVNMPKNMPKPNFEVPHNAKHEIGRQDLVRNVIKDNRENKNQTENNKIAINNKMNPEFHNQ